MSLDIHKAPGGVNPRNSQTAEDKKRTLEEQITRAVDLLRKKTGYRRSVGIDYHFAITVEALGDHRLDQNAKKVLAAIMRQTCFEEGVAAVRRSTIASLTALRPNLVSKKISQLVECGYIASVRVSQGQGQGTSSFYGVMGYGEEVDHDRVQNLRVMQDNIMKGITGSATGNVTNYQSHYDPIQDQNSDPVTGSPEGKVTTATSSPEEKVTQLEVPLRGTLRRYRFRSGERSTRARVHDPKKDKKEKNTKKKKSRSAEDAPEEIREAFERFWKAYPAETNRKGGKTPSLLKFWDITRGKFESNPAGGENVVYPACDAETLVRCAERFADACRSLEKRYIPGVEPWFNAGRWEAFIDWDQPDAKKFRIAVGRNGKLVKVPAED